MAARSCAEVCRFGYMVKPKANAKNQILSTSIYRTAVATAEYSARLVASSDPQDSDEILPDISPDPYSLPALSSAKYRSRYRSRKQSKHRQRVTWLALASCWIGSVGRRGRTRLPWLGSFLQGFDQRREFLPPRIGLCRGVEHLAVVAAAVRRDRRCGVNDHFVRHSSRLTGWIE